MMSHRAPILAVIALLAAAAPLAAQQKPDLAPYLIADRAAEVSLARSSAPRNVSDSATVLVLTRSGYVEASRGTNGFTCTVIRSFSGSITDPGLWSPKARAPHCFNAPATRTVLREAVKRAEWVMSGMSSTDYTARVKRAYDSHEFPLPAAGAMAYMLSPRQHLSEADPHWMPHLMFYFDKSQPAAWGGAGMTAPVIDASVGDPYSPVQTLLVPVRQWSNGKPAK
jgi:hypothetical protein